MSLSMFKVSKMEQMNIGIFFPFENMEQVLGTDAGGTQEIVEHNVTGLLHPIGRAGNHVLAQNLRFLLENRLTREQMGMEGRKKVQRMFLKQHMYEKLLEVLVKCMRRI